MPWQQLKFTAPADKTEALEQFLSDAGALSVTFLDAEDQAIFQLEPGATPLWDAVVINGLFSSDVDLAPIQKELSRLADSELELSFCVDILEDQDWEATWMADFHPIQISQHLWVCPNWLTPPDADAINIRLDPGLAFGSGTHPTTALCLQWLSQTDVKGKQVIDFGCGSGILAIAASLLGARSVLAIDNDPQAIIATKANRENNGIEPLALACYLPDQLQKNSQADILIANILSGPLIELAPTLVKLTKPDGKIVLSGLLPEQSDEVAKCYSRWFEMESPEDANDWVRLSGSRR
jgi:ribosomal protein L11 methyltransferase